MININTNVHAFLRASYKGVVDLSHFIEHIRTAGASRIVFPPLSLSVVLQVYCLSMLLLWPSSYLFTTLIVCLLLSSTLEKKRNEGR